jgi:hypothetical protein
MSPAQGGGGGAWATGSVRPPGRDTGLPRWPSTRRRAPSGNGHWANCWADGDGVEQAETRSGLGQAESNWVKQAGVKWEKRKKR